MNDDNSSLPAFIGIFIALTVLVLSLGFVNPAHAAVAESFTRDFQAETLKTYSFTQGRSANLYKKTDERGYGLRVAGMLDNSNARNNMANLERSAKLTTMMVNGTYDLPAARSDQKVRPFVLAGAGVAFYDTTSANSSGARGTNLVPVLKVGGGLAFRMGQKMDMTLSYKAGFAGGVSSLSSAQATGTQMVDVSVKYKF